MTIRVRYTGEVTARFSKILTFNDQAEYDDFKESLHDNLLCNLETEDLSEVSDLERFEATKL